MKSMKLGGFLAAIFLTAVGAQAALVANGGFETGDFTGWTCSGTPNAPASCPAASGDPLWLSVQNVGVNSGQFSAHLGAGFGATDILSQSIATTPGATYIVRFSFGEYVGNDPNNYLCCQNQGPDFGVADAFQASWDGNTIYSDSNFFADAVLGNYFYRSVSFRVTATGSSSTLQFTGSDNQQDVILDGVSVTAAATPEPGTWGLLLGSALIGAGLFRKKRT